jgi:hypothetical protein
VRIERHPSESVMSTDSDTDDGGFGGVGGKRRPRKSS